MSIINIFGTLFGGGKKKSGHSALLKALFEPGHSTDEVVGATVEVSMVRWSSPSLTRVPYRFIWFFSLD